MPSPLPPLVRFADFEVDLRAGQLRKRGAKLRLQEQPFRLLAALLESSGEVVTREELRSRLWPADTFVDFDHRLAAAISKLRDALNDSAENPRFVETVGRRGYRFMVRIESVVPSGEDTQSQVAPTSGALRSLPARRKSTLPRVAWTGAGLALFIVVGFFVLRHRRQQEVTASAVPRIS